MPARRRATPLLLLVLGACGSPIRDADPVAPAAPAVSAAPEPGALVWTSPGLDATGSVPLGNGQLGVNAWVEADGDLCLYLSRTDSWSEANRLLKVGKLRISADPPLLAAGAPFEQALRLSNGALEIRCGAGQDEVRLALWVDSRDPVVHVVAASERERVFEVAHEAWRSAPRRLQGEELKSAWTMRDAPDSIELVESADWLLEVSDALAWCHRNATSIVPLTLRHQGLDELDPALLAGADTLSGRSFGGYAQVRGAKPAARTQLRSVAPTRSLELALAAPCGAFDSVDAWAGHARAVLATARGPVASREATAAHWRQAWTRSWIVARGDADAERLTQAYALQRWVQRGGGGGPYPIKFNGSIFTVEPAAAGGGEWNADWRRWGGDFWWQNTRLPYHAMLGSGDFEQLEPLFSFYERMLPLCRARAEAYYGARGAYFPETVTHFGTYSNGDYGWNRAGLAKGDVQCPWWQWEWNQGFELVALMLDRHAHAPDAAFVGERVVPLARDVLAYFDSRFARDEHGVLVISPTQALETHWHGVVNDMPCVAGLRDVCARLLALPASIGTAEDRALWRRMLDAAPPLPLEQRDGRTRLAPAERYDPSRQNCESPELYAVWPFRLAGPGRALEEEARAAYELRHDRFENGWPQDGTDAALLGLTEEARRILVAKLGNSHPKYRFPATWGPNFDWLPDQCHGSNLMLLAQTMLLQERAGKLVLLPAWPREWDVSFRLHAPGATVVECEVEGGLVKRLDVWPAARRADIEISAPFSLSAPR
ncbi:MAG: hypothetical protein FJ299_14445 [Planctomycetes bacterium]|nr:hypothetical protein [Planctomycetota bacterium]